MDSPNIKSALNININLNINRLSSAHAPATSFCGTRRFLGPLGVSLASISRDLPHSDLSLVLLSTQLLLHEVETPYFSRKREPWPAYDCCLKVLEGKERFLRPLSLVAAHGGGAESRLHLPVCSSSSRYTACATWTACNQHEGVECCQ